MHINNISNVSNNKIDNTNVATFRGKNIAIINQPTVVTNNTDEVTSIAYVSNSRKIIMAIKNIPSDIKFSKLHSSNLHITEALYYKLMQLNNMNTSNTTLENINKAYQDVVDTILVANSKKDRENCKFELLPCDCDGPIFLHTSNHSHSDSNSATEIAACLIVACASYLIASSIYSLCKYATSPDEYKNFFHKSKDKIEQFHKLETKDLLSIKNISQKTSLLKDIDYSKILKYLYYNSDTSLDLLINLLYIGAISTWMDLVAGNINSNDTTNTEETNIYTTMAIVKIITYAISAIKLDMELLNLDKNNLDTNKNLNLIKAYKQLLIDSQKINQKYFENINNDNNKAHLKAVEDLANGFYFTTCIYKNPKAKTEDKTIAQYLTTTTNGLIKIGSTPNHPFKYTYYYPLLEIEYTTETVSSFVQMLTNMQSDFNFYRIDNSNSIIILNSFKNIITNKDKDKDKDT
jgi:hypothetical protein